MPDTIRTDTDGGIATIRLDRPKMLNALATQVMDEVVEAAEAFDRDPKIGAMILAGSDKAFAAGADIKEMSALDFQEALTRNFFAGWDRFTNLRKPVIAAVSGYALGGGCELAMMCDFIIAADNAQFGQPEITLGVMPGMGGSQRLARFVGKSKAMDMILTGRTMDAEEAERCGLVSRVVPLADLMEETRKAAEKIAGYGTPSVMLAKEAVNTAFETTLAQGVRTERRLFHSLFATEDQKEGMGAFLEKRSAQFANR